MEITQERWEKAYEHAKDMLEVCKILGDPGMFAAIQISLMIDLYKSGDRSAALLEDLEAIN